MAKDAKKSSLAVDMSNMPKRATIEKASNGYIVSGFNDKGEHNQSVHVDMESAHEALESMMGSSSKKENFAKTKEKAMKKMMKSEEC